MCHYLISAYLSVTLEQDLMESAFLIPEQYNALQSMIQNPLFYGDDDGKMNSENMLSGVGIVNTHASFDL